MEKSTTTSSQLERIPACFSHSCSRLDCCGFHSIMGVHENPIKRKNSLLYKQDWVAGFHSGFGILAPTTYIFFASAFLLLPSREQLSRDTEPTVNIVTLTLYKFLLKEGELLGQKHSSGLGLDGFVSGQLFCCFFLQYSMLCAIINRACVSEFEVPKSEDPKLDKAINFIGFTLMGCWVSYSLLDFLYTALTK
ncbi:hypothetical protein NC653_004874 [Populus alba x Populus x berolinensis]|uniref:Uncharacterized protein n=1 Tax=Populus alba x Populus x berolinensis TaxID=444605 RepID=A0AAD6RV23_9ROSI|nr:hypothetical protein NC653_004874 [Populus alba x Populus x berolinensis]